MKTKILYWALFILAIASFAYGVFQGDLANARMEASAL